MLLLVLCRIQLLRHPAKLLIVHVLHFEVALRPEL
jgi:hypothetical protein